MLEEERGLLMYRMTIDEMKILATSSAYLEKDAFRNAHEVGEGYGRYVDENKTNSFRKL